MQCQADTLTARTTAPFDMSAAPTADKPSAWYVAYTLPRQESVAQANLQRQGFQTYLPLYKADVHEPLFPRYIFFRPSTCKQSIAAVRSTRGVKSIVRFGMEFAFLRPEAIDSIQEQERRQNQADPDCMSAFQPGRRVRLRSPALSGLEGLVHSASSKRVMLLMEILGRQIAVKLEPHQVELA
jgi:transcriptional antiterminator RfaH